jgi:hypothetical protein
MPLAANDHAALTRACHLDCSRVTTFLGSELAAVNVRGYMFFDPALCRATVLVGPASNVDITVKKNGALWATIAFATGATDGVISFATPNTSAQAGDRLVFYGPAIRDPQMAGFSTTLASA